MKNKFILLAVITLLFSLGFVAVAKENKANISKVANYLRIGNIRTEKISPNSVTIKWDTNKAAYSKIYIATSTPVNTSGTPVFSSASSSTTFLANLQNLATSTNYFYKILASLDNTYGANTVSKEGIVRTQSKFINLNCASAAVVTRDDAIISAQTAFYTTTKIALEVRREALKTAWLIEDSSSRRSEIKKAWDAYKATAKTARKTFNEATKTAWNNFKKTRVDCKANGKDDQGAEAFDTNL